MKTLIEAVSNEYVIKNSKFITEVIPLNDANEVKDYLARAKVLYPKATHYCYAYKIADVKKSSDDNEPKATAGLPMLNILEKENLNNILVITIRYFGGIKLGAGGLIRAYSKSVKLALAKAELKELVKGYLIELAFSYNEQKQINSLLKNMKIRKKEYLNDVKYLVEVPKDKLDLIENYKYKIIDELDIVVEE